MAFGDWIVGVFLRFNTNGVVTMQRLSGATQEANAQILRQQGLIDKNQLAMMRLTRRTEELRLAQMRLGTTLAGGAAAAGITSMVYAVDKAAQLQRTLIGIQNVTGAKSTAGFYNQAMTLGNMFGMSPQDAAEIMRTTARMSAGQMTGSQMSSAMPKIAEYAMLMHQNRGLDVDRAATVGIGLAHMFRAYDPKSLGKMLDMNLRMSEMMGEGPEQAMRQMAYYVPLLKNLNVSDDASMATMALLDRAGFRNKVGTNVRAMVLQTLGPLQMTKFAQQGKNGMLNQMGITDAAGNIQSRFTQNGQYDMFGVLAQLVKWEQIQLKSGKTLEDINKVLYGTFGKQGGTIAALFADPKMGGFLQSIRKYLNNPAVSMDEQAKRTQTGLLFQAGRAGANFQALATELAWPWLSSLTGSLKSLGDTLHGWQQWLHGHSDIEKRLGAIFSIFTGLASARFVIGMAALARNSMMAMAAIPRLATAIEGLAGAADIATGQIVADEARIGVAGRAGGIFKAVTGFSPTTAAAVGGTLAVGGLLYGASQQGKYGDGGMTYGSDLNHGGAVTNPYQETDVSGRPIQHSVHINTVNLNMPKGTPEQHAQLFVQSLMRLQGPGSKTLPNVPLSVGNLAFGI